MFKKILSRIVIFLLALTSFSNFNTAKIVSAASNSLTRNVYYAYGMDASAISSIDAEKYKITHICYAFMYVDSSGKLTSSKSTTPSGDYYVDSSTDAKLKALVKLKEKYPWLKIIVSIGGGDSQQTSAFVNVTASQSKRDIFAASCKRLVDAYKLDGIDLDWEQPENTEEANNYRRLCRDIREEIGAKGNGKVLTIAVPVSSSFINNIIADQVSSLNEYLDFWNIMTYDLGSSSKYSFIAPLYRTSGSETYGFISVSEGIELYNKVGVAYKDMNLGVPFYGKMVTGISLSSTDSIFGKSVSGTVTKPNFSEIQNYYESGQWTYNWSSGAKCPYLTYTSGGKITKIVTYDDEKSLGYKIDYAKSLGIGGMMVWAYKGDNSTNLLKTKLANNINLSTSGSETSNGVINETFDTLPKFVTSRGSSEANGTWFASSSMIKEYRLSGTNGGSLKLTPVEGRYTIDLYIRFKDCSTSSTLSFDTRVNSSSKITKIRKILVEDNKGTVLKDIVPTDTSMDLSDSFKKITTRSLGNTEGWIHIQYYAEGATASDGIYIDNFIVGK